MIAPMINWIPNNQLEKIKQLNKHLMIRNRNQSYKWELTKIRGKNTKSHAPNHRNNQMSSIKHRTFKMRRLDLQWLRNLFQHWKLPARWLKRHDHRKRMLLSIKIKVIFQSVMWCLKINYQFISKVIEKKKPARMSPSVLKSEKVNRIF